MKARKIYGLKNRPDDVDLDAFRIPVPMAGRLEAEIAVADIRPQKTDRPNDPPPTLVFIHGYAGCAETWEHQVQNLQGDFRLILPDLRGHGQSDAPDTSYAMADLTEDLREVLEHRDIGPAWFLIAHSFGGAVALEFLLEETFMPAPAGLILISIPSAFPIRLAGRILSAPPSVIYRPFWRFRTRWNAEPHVMKRMMRQSLDKWRLSPAVSGIQIPTLIISGEDDHYFPEQLRRATQKAMPHAEILNIPNARHKVQLQQPAAVNQAIRSFADRSLSH